MRLKPEEDSLLKRYAAAAGLSRAAHIKRYGINPPHSSARASTTTNRNRDILAKILAWFGKSELPKSMRSLAHAARSGSLPVSPETNEALQKTCRLIDRVCCALLAALGHKEGPP